jgi:hypothetical protein
VQILNSISINLVVFWVIPNLNNPLVTNNAVVVNAVLIGRIIPTYLENFDYNWLDYSVYRYAGCDVPGYKVRYPVPPQPNEFQSVILMYCLGFWTAGMVLSAPFSSIGPGGICTGRHTNYLQCMWSLCGRCAHISIPW